MVQPLIGSEASPPTGIDVVFIAPDASRDASAQRTVVFAPGQPIPRVGECVILAFGAVPVRWQVQDVAHIFEGDGHGIAIKLAAPAD